MNKILFCLGILIFSLQPLMSEEKPEVIDNFEHEIPTINDVVKAYYTALRNEGSVLSGGTSIKVNEEISLNYGVMMLASKHLAENKDILNSRLLSWVQADSAPQRFIGFCTIINRTNSQSASIAGYSVEELKRRQPTKKELDAISLLLQNEGKSTKSSNSSNTQP